MGTLGRGDGFDSWVCLPTHVSSCCTRCSASCAKVVSMIYRVGGVYCGTLSLELVIGGREWSRHGVWRLA